MQRKRWMLGLALIAVLSLTVVPGCGMAQMLAAQSARANEPAVAALPAPTPVSTESVSPVISSGSLAAIEGTLQEIYQNTSPSVTYIEVLQEQSIGMGQVFPFFGNPDSLQPPEEQYQRSSGSGFVWDKAGHIVTNNHVVDGADKIKVKFSDGMIVEGTVVGTDPDSDLAVVKVDLPADQLHPVQLADSTLVQVGQLAIAIGNPFGLENTMTVGIVSALGRSLPVESDGSMGGSSYTIPDVIQTDAPINPGNSGGVLMNDQGQVIGVTAAIASPVQASAGVGFAIPSTIVQKVVPVLIEKGHYAHSWLGVSGTTMNPDLAQAMGLGADQRGTLVVDIVPDGPADKAGLHGSDRKIAVDGNELRIGGDIIVAIDGQSVETFEDLTTYLVRSTEVGQEIALTVLRDGQEHQVEVTLGERPGNEAEADLTRADPARKAWLGISGITVSSPVAQAMGLPEDQEGVLVVEIASDSPADEAELRGSYKPVTIGGQRLMVGGDVIVAWDGQSVAGMEELIALLGEASPGQEVELTILRDGTQMKVQVTLDTRPTS
jgi:serine protease Do